MYSLKTKSSLVENVKIPAILFFLKSELFLAFKALWAELERLSDLEVLALLGFSTGTSLQPARWAQEYTFA